MRPRFNFCAASSRDEVVFGAERPGHVPPPPGVPGTTPRPPAIPTKNVDEWVAYMKEQGVARVLCLMSPAETGFYETPLLAQYNRAFGADNVLHVPPGDKDTRRRMLSFLSSSAATSTKVVVHCSSGQVRTGNALALWLLHQYLLTPTEAVGEVQAFAAAHHATRRPSADGLLRLVSPTAGAAPGTLSASAMRRMSSVTSASSAASSAPVMHRGVGMPPSTARSAASTAAGGRPRTGNTAATPPPTVGRPGGGPVRGIPSLPLPPSPVATDAAPSATPSALRRPPTSASLRSARTTSSALPSGAASVLSGPPVTTSRTSVGSLAVRLGLRTRAQAALDTHVTFLQMGGTIDKDYPRSLGGYAFEIGEPAVVRVLQRLHVPVPFAFSVATVCQKDSQEVDAEDRKRLVGACCGAVGSRIIVTHGTDTMVETGRFLQGALRQAHSEPRTAAVSKLADKTIVLTGAMRPERFGDSDAPVNIGAALAACGLLPPGVYISMHGQVLDPACTTRLASNGCFVAHTPGDDEDIDGDADNGSAPAAHGGGAPPAAGSGAGVGAGGSLGAAAGARVGGGVAPS